MVILQLNDMANTNKILYCTVDIYIYSTYIWFITVSSD